MFNAYFSFIMLLTKEAIATVFCDNDNIINKKNHQKIPKKMKNV